MKKYICLFLLILLPLSLQAHLLKASKFDLIQEANKHKNAARSELLYAEDMCVYIPNLGKRDHLKTLIASSFSAITIPEPRAKLLAVGLSIIGSLACDITDNISELKYHLANAAYHFEMANFYNQISISFSDWPSEKDEGSKYFLNAIDNLTVSEMLTQCIEDDLISMAISDELCYQRDLLISQFQNAPTRLSKKLSKQGWSLYENIDEIIADCQDEELREEISAYVYAMVEDLECAENCWGVK